jgi:hypothetical protein
VDAETVRILIATSGAIVAGFLGSIVAGRWSRGNARLSIDAAEKAAKAERDAAREAERDRWIRDQKREAYDGFLIAAENLVDAFHFGGDFVAERTPLRIARGRVKLLGSVQVRKSAARVVLAASRLIDSRIGMNELMNAIHTFIQTTREDLGTDTAEDANLSSALDGIPVDSLGTRPILKTFTMLGGGEEEEEE